MSGTCIVKSRVAKKHHCGDYLALLQVLFLILILVYNLQYGNQNLLDTVQHTDPRWEIKYEITPEVALGIESKLITGHEVGGLHSSVWECGVGLDYWHKFNSAHMNTTQMAMSKQFMENEG